mmetsp:Transcript_18248/g.13259  ORF Transcript_18248/g.13259 Transcript_18248/m.13259 type:complete len:85 (-) Transcript_18248:643-897(-)
MVDNFKLSSSVLLERLKDLEAQQSFGERPQTAHVLNNISSEANGRRIGGGKPKVESGYDSEDDRQGKPIKCPNCKELIPNEQLA